MNNILFYLKVINNEQLPIRGVFSHVESKQVGYFGFLIQYNRLEPDVLPYKTTKLPRGDFSQTFKAGNFRLVAQFMDSPLSFLIRITVNSIFFIPDPKQGSIEDI